MNSIKDLEQEIDISKIPIKYLIGIHKLQENYPTLSDIQWEVISYSIFKQKEHFTIRSLGYYIFNERINDDQEQNLLNSIKLLKKDNKVKDGDRKDRFVLTNKIFEFND